jgi:hypothetical protein
MDALRVTATFMALHLSQRIDRTRHFRARFVSLICGKHSAATGA